MKDIFKACLFLAAVCFNQNAHAGYAWWGDGKTHDGYSVDFQPNVDPGPASNVYWASQYWLADGTVGYFGMQTPRSNGGGQMLWSVWAAKAYVQDGSPGVTCGAFNEGGAGYSCHTHFNWTQGYTYRFNLSALGSGWYRLTITELKTGIQINLGKIQVAKPGITSGVNWDEYFDWNDASYDWSGAPHSEMTWSNLMTSDGKTLSFSSTDTDISFADKNLQAIVNPYPTRSTELPLINAKSGQCLFFNSGITSTACPSLVPVSAPSRNVTWTLTSNAAGSQSQIHAYGSCLMTDATGATVTYSSPCGSSAASPSAATLWINNLSTDGTIRSSITAGNCLTDNGGGVISLSKCAGLSSQKWSQYDRYKLAQQWIVNPVTVKAGNNLIFNPTVTKPYDVNTAVNVKFNNGGAAGIEALTSAAQISLDGVTWGNVTFNKNVLTLPAGYTNFYVQFTTAANSPYENTSLQVNNSSGIGTVTPPLALWSVANATAVAGQYLIFKLELNEPAATSTWTLIKTDVSKAPGVANFWNNTAQVSFDGVHWGQSVYYGDDVILPAGQRSIYVRLQTQANIKATETVSLTVTEQATGFSNTPVTAIGTVSP